MSSVHILQYFVVIQGGSRSIIQTCMLALGFCPKSGGHCMAILPFKIYEEDVCPPSPMDAPVMWTLHSVHMDHQLFLTDRILIVLLLLFTHRHSSIYGSLHLSVCLVTGNVTVLARENSVLSSQ